MRNGLLGCRFIRWGLYGLMSAVALSLLLYGTLGVRLIRTLYESDSSIVKSAIMEGREATPLWDYLARSEAVFLINTLRLFVLIFLVVFIVWLIKQPSAALLATVAALVGSAGVVEAIEFLDLTTSPYLAKIEYFEIRSYLVRDEVSGFRQKPLMRAKLAYSFSSNRDRLFYGIEPHTLMMDWETDADGFRNSSPVGRSDVVVLGDGFITHSADDAGDERNTFGKKLEADLSGHTVRNLGISSSGPFQYVDVMRRYGVKLKPKFAVLGFNEGNDLNDIATHVLWQRGEGDYFGPHYYFVDLRSFWERYPAAIKSIGSRIRTVVLEFGSEILKGIMIHTGFEYPRHPDLAHVMIGSSDESYDMVFSDRPLPTTTEQRPPTSEVNLLRTLLSEFKALCIENEILPLVLFIPSAQHIYAEYSTGQSGERWLSVREEHIASSANLEMAMIAIADELDIEIVDLTPVFQEAANSGEMLYGPINAHWNSAGMELAARFVADHLKARLHVSSVN